MTTTKEDVRRWFENGDEVVAIDLDGGEIGIIESVDRDGDCYVGGRLFLVDEVRLFSVARIPTRARNIEAKLESLIHGISSGEADEGGIGEAQAILREFRLLLEDIGQIK